MVSRKLAEMDNQIIIVNAVGDIMGGKVGEKFDEDGENYPFDHIGPVIFKAKVKG